MTEREREREKEINMYVRSRPRISRENRTEEEDKIYDTWITKSLKLYNCFGKIWNAGELGIPEIRRKWSPRKNSPPFRMFRPHYRRTHFYFSILSRATFSTASVMKGARGEGEIPRKNSWIKMGELSSRMKTRNIRPRTRRVAKGSSMPDRDGKQRFRRITLPRPTFQID